MNEKEFKIRAYGKCELAMMYFPENSKHTALKKLRFWLSVNERLKHLVSREKNHYTPKQVKLIVDELGEP